MNKAKITYKNWGGVDKPEKKKGLPENLSFNNCGSSASDITIIQDELIPISDEDSKPKDGRESTAKGTSWRQFSRREILLFLLFSVTNFFAGLTFSLMAPFYPAEAEAKGVSASQYGMVFGIFELVAFVTSPIFGKYLHVIGPRRTFVIGILITGVSTTFFGVLDKADGSTFLALSFVVRIIAALGDAALVTANFTLVAMEFPRYVATTFATLETFFGLGLIVGPTVGGVFYEMGGFKLPFLTVGVAFSLIGLLACVIMTEDRERDDSDEKTPGIFSVLKVPTVSLAGISILAGSISMGFLSATLEPHVRQFNLSPVQTGFVFMIYGGIYALTAPAWGWLCDKLKGAFVLTLFGETIIFVGFLIIGPVAFLPIDTVLWMTCVGLAVYGIGLGATMVSSFIMALEEAIGHGFSDNVQTYGVVSALWNSFFALGAFIGPSLGGVLVDLGGFRWASVFVLSSQLVVLVLFSGFMMTTREGGVHDRFAQNLSDTTPLLGQEGPCSSKRLAGESFISSTDFSGKYYGTNEPLLSKSLSSSSS